MEILTKQQRNNVQNSVKIAIFGQYGIGKTSLLKTLDCNTLCLDFEAGMLSVQDWNGDSISIRSWEDARHIACLLGNYNPSAKAGETYSQAHYEALKNKYDNSVNFDIYQCIFIDSISIASKLCLEWCKKQKSVISERTGNVDLRAVYGLLAQEMYAWIWQFQHIVDKDIVFIGLLKSEIDPDFRTTDYFMQLEGSKTASELPAIIDQVVSMVFDENDERKFVCQTKNKKKYPAKDRSGKLDEIEEAHLGKLLAKIKGQDDYILLLNN